MGNEITNEMRMEMEIKMEEKVAKMRKSRISKGISSWNRGKTDEEPAYLVKN